MGPIDCTYDILELNPRMICTESFWVGILTYSGESLTKQSVKSLIILDMLGLDILCTLPNRRRPFLLVKTPVRMS